MSDFWQAPGNGKGFDSYLGDNSKMNNRTIGVLSYIKENSQELGFVAHAQFLQEIKNYLLTHFYENPNESLGSHFYRPALFYGFLHLNKAKHLSLSIEGNLFLNSYNKQKYIECKKLILNQLDNAVYPNQATAKVKTLKLSPFRILFKLLLENQQLTSQFISKNLVHIKNYTALEKYIKTKNITNISTFEFASSKYKKFNTWTINSLVDLQILTLTKGFLSIHHDVKEHLHTLYDKLNYGDMFFEVSSCELDESISHKRVQRDHRFIIQAKKRDKYLCQINASHITFLSKEENYVEGHHIVPMYQQKNYVFKMDDLNNITSLCPNCHREIHSADNKQTILQKLYNLNYSYMQNNNINLNDLYKMYACA